MVAYSSPSLYYEWESRALKYSLILRSFWELRKLGILLRQLVQLVMLMVGMLMGLLFLVLPV